jgi:hypothetical protein
MALPSPHYPSLLSYRLFKHPLIETGATANGFTAQCEYELGNGGIVDVHLEQGEYRVAVEIAIASRPRRELAHINNALAVRSGSRFSFFVSVSYPT